MKHKKIQHLSNNPKIHHLSNNPKNTATVSSTPQNTDFETLKPKILR